MVEVNLTGGLGNTCFQIATTIAYAKKWGMGYSIPTKVSNPHNKENPSPHFFKNINYSDRELNLPVYKEKNFTYEEIPYMKHLCLQGYFQSEMYFLDYRNDIIDLFDIKPKTKEGYISCHIRRGDYLTLSKFHITPTIEYIKKSMDYFTSSGYKNFIFLSDDIAWCKSNFRGGEYFFSENKNDIEDLELAASCEHNIGSASSYSWWIHYFNPNPNKMGIFPEKWFSPGIRHNTNDLYLPTSIKI